MYSFDVFNIFYWNILDKILFKKIVHLDNFFCGKRKFYIFWTIIHVLLTITYLTFFTSLYFKLLKLENMLLFVIFFYTILNNTILIKFELEDFLNYCYNFFSANCWTYLSKTSCAYVKKKKKKIALIDCFYGLGRRKKERKEYCKQIVPSYDDRC